MGRPSTRSQRGVHVAVPNAGRNNLKRSHLPPAKNRLKRKMSSRSRWYVSKQTRFNAGIRCHFRIYKSLLYILNNISRTFINIQRKAKSASYKLLSCVLKCSPPITGARDKKRNIVFLFEVNLDFRRPDCICIVGSGKSNAPISIIIIELKTCRFSTNLHTDTKHRQRILGREQLRESVTLLRKLVPRGASVATVYTILAFVSQRGLSILSVQQRLRDVIETDFEVLVLTLRNRSEFYRQVVLPVTILQEDREPIDVHGVDKDSLRQSVTTSSCRRNIFESMSTLWNR
ncbi:nuclear protein [Psittacid alphaherpesvirus 5]|uniref:Nuclear protein n=1 Tax=Psittacid alphaherpesvirus 5 TaxID=2972693 RepID=A0A5P9JQY4_9ALPH|nr:nuclear protein [Psittacid alphaherpesvirus 5]QFU14561.1 nuclear protein [Psittacid alphaherpesvirus 5]UOO01032.1 nuclear protein [Psittacid alphaherpesvirus 5]